MLGFIIGPITSGGGGGGGSGTQILSGDGPPSSAIGSAGDYYIDKTTPSIYGPKNNGLWPAPIGLGGTSFVTHGGSTDPFIATQAGAQYITFPVDNPMNVELLINGLLQPESVFEMNRNVATVYASANVRPGDSIEFTYETIDAGESGGLSTVSMDEVPAGAIDGSNTVFSLTGTPIIFTLRIYLNGVLQDSDDFSLNNRTVTFNLPPQANQKVRAIYDYHR